MISIGTVCQITHDIIVEGQVAFRAGENVSVESISPNPQRPEYMYVVTSSSLQKKFQLSDGDLMTVAPTFQPPPQPVQVPMAATPGAAPYPPAGYQAPNEKSAVSALVLGILSFFLCPIIFGILAIVIGKGSEKKIDQSGGQLGGRGLAHAGVICGWINVILVIVLIPVIALGVPVFLSANSSAQRRTCQANLRTIDGAINTYNAEYDAYPPGGEVGDILVPELIKKNPTCPTSDEPYVLTPSGDPRIPPAVACPTNEPGHTI
jgi:hypothetical protein